MTIAVIPFFSGIAYNFLILLSGGIKNETSAKRAHNPKHHLQNNKFLEEKVMSKKIISVVLVIVTVLSTLTVTASAASYSTGN